MEKCKCWVASRPQIGRSTSKAHRRSTLRSSKAQEKHCAQQLTALNMQAVPSAHDPTHFAYDSDICKPGFFVDASNVIRGGSVKQQMGGGRCLPAANVQCINIKNAIQTHQIWSGGECQPMSATWSGLFVWMHACTTLVGYNWSGPEISTICIFCKFLWILVIFNKYFGQRGTQSD